MVKTLVFLASGFEEIETSTIVDVLRRADVKVTVASLNEGPTEGSRGMKFVPDKSVSEVDVADFDAVVCPGGSLGCENLRNDQRVIDMIKGAFDSNKLVAAVCASPAVLSDAGVLKKKVCTIYPGMEDELKKGGGKPKDGIVAMDGNVITSKGPATALPFALKIVEKLVGKDAAKDVRKRTLVDTLNIEY